MFSFDITEGCGGGQRRVRAATVTGHFVRRQHVHHSEHGQRGQLHELWEQPQRLFGRVPLQVASQCPLRRVRARCVCQGDANTGRQGWVSYYGPIIWFDWQSLAVDRDPITITDFPPIYDVTNKMMRNESFCLLNII